MNCQEFDSIGRYLVTSERDLTVRYCVDVLAFEGEGECDCDDWKHRIGPHLKAGTVPPRRHCKHILEAREALLDKVITQLVQTKKDKGTYEQG